MIHDRTEFPTGWTVIEVLPFLVGLPYDDLAQSYIHAPRPSVVVVVRDYTFKCDAVTWRITVTLGAGDIIENIEQEVEVELRGFEHGYALRTELDKRHAALHKSDLNEDLDTFLERVREMSTRTARVDELRGVIKELLEVVGG